LAAALALLACYWFWPEGGNAPRLANVTAGVKLLRSRQRLPATVGLRIQPGDTLETGPGQLVVVEFPREGTRLELNPETRLSVVDWHKGKHVVLHRGQFRASVAPQPGAEPMVVTTPEGEATVRGTEFTLSSQWSGTWLKVTKGMVELRGKSADNPEAVKAGQFAVAARNVELKARPTGQAVLRIPVPVDPRLANSGGDGVWTVAGDTVRQRKVSRFPDLKPGAPSRENPFSWYSRQIPAEGNLEVTAQVRLDAAVEEQGPLGFAEFGFTLIFDRKHLSFICLRDPYGSGMAKLHSFMFNGPPTVEPGESEERLRATMPFPIGQTYLLKVRLNRLNSGQVHFLAKVWPRGENEPPEWQLDAIRNAPLAQPMISLDTRRCACTFTEVQAALIE